MSSESVSGVNVRSQHVCPSARSGITIIYLLVNGDSAVECGAHSILRGCNISFSNSPHKSHAELNKQRKPPPKLSTSLLNMHMDHCSPSSLLSLLPRRPIHISLINNVSKHRKGTHGRPHHPDLLPCPPHPGPWLTFILFVPHINRRHWPTLGCGTLSMPSKGSSDACPSASPRRSWESTSLSMTLPVTTRTHST